MRIPENLLSLHAAEESIREQALKTIAESDALAAHLGAIHDAMNILVVFARLDFKPASREHTLQLIGLRLLNNANSVLKLGFSGYYQTAAHLLRDKLEVANLLDLFSVEPEKLEMWRAGDEQTIRRQFSPVEVRAALERNVKFAGQRRDGLYRVFSVYAAHPTYKSFELISPGNTPQLGCFFSHQLLEAVLVEEARHLSHATITLSELFGTLDEKTQSSQGGFERGLRDYFERHIRPSTAESARNND